MFLHLGNKVQCTYLKYINNQLENEFDQKLGFESRRVYTYPHLSRTLQTLTKCEEQS